MRDWGDERGQSIQIGAVLLFGILIIFLSIYQAFVVPNQNKKVEFNHNQEVQTQMQDLRNEIVSAVGRSTTVAVSLDLGTRFPTRIIAVNPPPPSGRISTVGTEDSNVALTIDNATATEAETSDVWDGTQRNYTTGLIEYDPSYSLYTEAPDTYYGNTLVYNQFRTANLTVTDQSIVDGTDITLVAVNGSLSAARSGSYSVDVEPVSSAGESILVKSTGATGNVTITFASKLPAEKWRDVLSEEISDTSTDDKYVVSVEQNPGPGEFYNISIELESGATYQLRMAKVGVGSKIASEPAAYLTALAGEGASVEKGSEVDVTLAVRDEFNNPEANVSVNASVATGTFTDSRKYTGTDGEVTFTYEATGTTGDTKLNFSLDAIGSGFDQSTGENVTVNVTVTKTTSSGGSGGAYDVNWLTNGGDDLTVDLAGSPSTTKNLDAGATLKVEGLELDYAVNNTSVATVDPGIGTTNSSGENRTTLTATETGTVAVYVVSGGSSDVINVTVIDSGGGGGAASQVTADNNIALNGSGNSFFFRFDTGGSTFTVRNTSIDTTNMPDGSRSALKQVFIDGTEVYNSEYASDGSTLSVTNTDVTGSTSMEFKPFSSGQGNTKLPGTASDYSFVSSQPSGEYIAIDIGFSDGTEKTFYVEYTP